MCEAEKAHTNWGSSSSNPGSVISCFQPAALLSERLMDFKRVKNDDHPHKWACQIQDRVLEQHFKRGVLFFFSLLVEIWTYATVLTTQLSCLVSQKKGKPESAVTWLYAPTLREVSRLNVWNDVASLSLIIWCWRWLGMCRTNWNLMMTMSQIWYCYFAVLMQKKAHCRTLQVGLNWSQCWFTVYTNY